MSRTRVLTDAQWELISPLMPSSDGKQGKPFRDHRQVVEGIIYRYRTGIAWRDLPVQYGPWKTVWKRHFRWSTDGTHQQMMQAVQAAGLLDEAACGDVERLFAVDSTIVRAHQHAAGARRDSVAEPADDTGGRIELHEFSGGARGAA